MPGRNTLKVYISDTYYHLYNRGINKGAIFRSAADYKHFEYLLARTLADEGQFNDKGRTYARLREKIDLSAYCLMPNHFHLLAFQRTEDGITKLMSSVSAAYTVYFNKKYGRRGPLFENTYRAVMIQSDEQLLHITRYIHLNHDAFRTWPHSSFSDYLSDESRSWIVHAPILSLFSSKAAYCQFVLDYEATQWQNDQLKHELDDLRLY